MIGVSCYLAAKQNLGVPMTYAECVELLCRASLLDEVLADTVTRVVGLRNLLVCEYASIDVGRLYLLLDRLDDFRQFAQQVYPHAR